MADTLIRGRLLVLASAPEDAHPYAAAAEKLAVDCVLGVEAGAGGAPEQALHLRFSTRDSALEIVQYAMEHPLVAVIAADARCAPSCARAESMLGHAWHPPKAADACLDIFALRQKLANAGLRAAVLAEPPAGRDLAICAILDRGKLRVLGAVEGERATSQVPRPALEALYRATRVLMLAHGPVCAQVRVAGEEVWIQELAPAIPIRLGEALKFKIPLVDEDVSLAEVVVRHALGRDIARVYRR